MVLVLFVVSEYAGIKDMAFPPGTFSPDVLDVFSVAISFLWYLLVGACLLAKVPLTTIISAQITSSC